MTRTKGRNELEKHRKEWKERGKERKEKKKRGKEREENWISF